MYPIVYKYDAVDFSMQGFGSLSDCISCEVTEELNGSYTLELKYPLNGIHAQHLITGNIIVAQPSHNQSRQPFRISEIKKSFSNSIQVYANHICYDLSGYPVRASATYGSLAAVINAMNSMTWYPASVNQFTFTTDMSSSRSFSMDAIQTVRSWMGGQDGSILDVYGGEWLYDNFSCYLTSRRGKDTGYRISYGKNLAEYDKKSDYSIYTHICAYWKKGENVVYSDIMPTGVTGVFRCAYYDASKDYESKPSTAQLNTTASAKASSVKVDVETIQVTPSQIGNDVIGLGDSVLICYDTVFATRVIKAVWDVLAGEYKSLTLGTKQQSISDTIKSLSVAPNGGLSGSGVDYVIAQGISNGWRYRKWASGNADAIRLDVNSSTGDTSRLVITTAEINTLFGVTNVSTSNTTLVCANGNALTQSAHIDGSTTDGTYWYAVFDRSISGTITIIEYLVYMGGIT